ncbi:MAG: GtrA family protein [Rikenellaceae bacterium]
MRELITNINDWIASIITRLIDLLYLPIVRRFVSRTTLRYFVCGVCNYILFDAVVYYLVYHNLLGCREVEIASFVISAHVASLIVVFPITFLTGFWLNRYVAFNVTQPTISSQITKYALSVAGSIVLSYVALKFFVERVEVWATPAKILCSVITSLYSYLLARYYTFRSKH